MGPLAAWRGKVPITSPSDFAQPKKMQSRYFELIAQLDSLRQHDPLSPSKAELTRKQTRKQEKVDLLVHALGRRGKRLGVESTQSIG